MRTISQDLQEFFTWLETVRHMKRRTASVYTSCVRAILRKYGNEPTQEDLNDYFSSDNARVSHRPAWKQYVKWNLEDKGQLVQDAPDKPREGVRSRVHLPQDVVAALYFCIRRCKVRLVDVETLMWGYVVKTRLPYRTFIKIDPENPHTYAVPDECIEVFRKYAQPVNGFTPLIPMQPGSQFAVPTVQLKRELLNYEKLRLATERNGTPLEGFDPYVECEAFFFADKASSETPLPPLEEHIVASSDIPPGLDVPLSQGITTAELLAALNKPTQPFVLDIDLFEKRGIDYPGDWRYLVGEDE